MHKLEGQEMNVKNLCRKENIANHGEDPWWISSQLASSIYHCFFFLDLPLVMSDGDPV